MELPILYEDNDMVAVYKPSGLMTHADGRNKEETAADWFAAKYPESSGVGETQRLQDGTELLRPGVVHRLDRETSGVLLFAKTKEAHAHLKEVFQTRRAEKNYCAFVYGVPKEEKGIIDFSIGRSRKDFRLRSAQPKAKGLLREALTHYKVLTSSDTHALLKVMPKTGRTHQIRVHLKAIHHPVVCDPLYAPNHACDLGFKRLALHAYSLTIPTLEGKEVTITSTLPEEFTEALKAFREPTEALP